MRRAAAWWRALDDPGPYRRALVGILALALLARLAVGLPRLDGPPDDPDNYLPLARSVAEGRGLSLNGRPTAYRPPLYPIVLAPLARLPDRGVAAGVVALHAVLGLATVALAASAARGWGLSRRAALLAAGLTAFDPVLVVQARSVMTETLAAALVAGTLAGLTRPGLAGPALGGLGFGLASLCRPSLLPAAALAAVAALILPPGGWRERVGRAAILAGVTLATLAPWAWRNARAVGEPVWTTTHGGYTLALANNPAYYADVLEGPQAVWTGPNQQRWFESVAPRTRGMSEPEADRALRRDAIALAIERPSDFARASLARLGRFWGLAPSSAVYPGPLRRLTAAWTAPFWLAAAAGLARPAARRWPAAAAPATALALTIVHAFYWTDLRMRAPLVPALALMAALGLAGRPERPGKA